MDSSTLLFLDAMDSESWSANSINFDRYMRWIFIILLLTARIFPPDTIPHSHNGFITVPASKKYISPSILGEIFTGSNYRREWETPVTMPVFNIKKTNYKIVKMGGGLQTISLDMVDDKNREWTLRSIDKNVLSLKRYQQNIFVQSVIQDGISGSYPYAELSVPDIAHAAGVPAGEQYLYFVPDDSAFGEYRSLMANKVFILINTQPQPEKAITTTMMLEKLKQDKQCYVDEKEYLKARLVDWLVADWDRHIDQFRWIEKRTDSGVAFFVVPRDHDQAFFRSNGLLVKVVGRPHLNKFNSSGSGIEALSEKTRDLDKRFTAQLQKEDWEMIIKQFQHNVTDSVIEVAIKKQPREIFAISGNDMIGKLISRRDGLLKHVMEYYSFLGKLILK
ncbi:MAG: hypothetical protein JWO92_488 [Chitinophagaceae bacterium]|nr:hypothetical protein [Chitinophagaceae bacterium]